MMINITFVFDVWQRSCSGIVLCSSFIVVPALVVGHLCARVGVEIIVHKGSSVCNRGQSVRSEIPKYLELD